MKVTGAGCGSPESRSMLKCHPETADNVRSTGQRPKDLPETMFQVRP